MQPQENGSPVEPRFPGSARRQSLYKELRHVNSYAQGARDASQNRVYAGEAGQEAAARWLDLNAKFAETERELALARDRVPHVIRPWHEDTCARRKAHESAVVVETPTGALRVSFQHRRWTGRRSMRYCRVIGPRVWSSSVDPVPTSSNDAPLPRREIGRAITL